MRLGWVFVLLLLSPSSFASPIPTLRTAEGRSALQLATPVFLAGLARGCVRDIGLEQAIVRRLSEKGLRVGLLTGVAGKEQPVCSGSACARWFSTTCRTATGRVLWGQAVPGWQITKTRLYLHDLATGQTVSQDDYCQGCDLASAVTAHAEHLLQSTPGAGGLPSGNQPSYCGGSGAGAGSPSASSAPLFLTVYGEGKHKGALQTALKQQLGLLGRKVMGVAVESRTYTSDILRKIVAGHPRAQVLGAELSKDGNALLFLYDSASDQTDGKTVPCSDCDRDQQIAQVKQAVVELLDKCFGERCGQGSSPAASTAPPPEACEPFPEATCSDGTVPGTLPARHIDATTAKLVKGALWGLTAATAATSIALFAADTAGAGRISDRPGLDITNTLSGPAWGVLGVATGALIIAVPLTIVIQHATIHRSGDEQGTESSAQFTCPN